MMCMLPIVALLFATYTGNCMIICGIYINIILGAIMLLNMLAAMVYSSFSFEVQQNVLFSIFFMIMLVNLMASFVCLKLTKASQEKVPSWLQTMQNRLINKIKKHRDMMVCMAVLRSIGLFETYTSLDEVCWTLYAALVDD